MCKMKESDQRSNYGHDWELGFRFGDEEKVEKLKNSIPVSRSRVKLWMTRAITTILLWTCFVQLMALGELWRPELFKPCSPMALQSSSFSSSSSPPYKVFLPPKSKLQVSLLLNVKIINSVPYKFGGCSSQGFTRTMATLWSLVMEDSTKWEQRWVTFFLVANHKH